MLSDDELQEHNKKIIAEMIAITLYFFTLKETLGEIAIR